jgi:hypothetical protein
VGSRLFAIAGVLAVLLRIGAATPAGASGLSIGAGSAVKLGDSMLNLGCNDLSIQSAGTLQAQTSTITLGGNWDNQGTFDAGSGTVVFGDGCIPNQSKITGSSTFFGLQIMTSTGKTIDFGAGATQTVLDDLTLMGTAGNLLVIHSSIPDQQAFLKLDLGGSQNIDYVDVADTGATGQTLTVGTHSVDSGNTTGWSFDILATVTPTGPSGAPTNPAPTAIPSGAPTSPATALPRNTPTGPPLAPTPTRTPTLARVPCPGDCADTGVVSIGDLIVCVNIALGSEPVGACSACDGDGSGAVTINELISAVNAALNGC